MPARSRRSTAAAIALTTALTVGAAALLTGCGPDVPGPTASPSAGAPSADGPSAAAPSAGASGPATASAKPGSPATPSSAPKPTAAPSRNGTAHSALTISNGTNLVLMDGTSVDFGTVVRDLAWSPDGSKAAFIDGSGNLVTSNPNGSGRVTVARNPGGQTWSHPTWQVVAHDPTIGAPARSNLFFAATQNGVSRLEGIATTAVNGTPQQLGLDSEGGETATMPPQTNNTWPNAGGTHGAAAYANTADGKVYIRDDYIREMASAITTGSQPALSPDENELVFVRSSGGHDHVFEQSVRDGGAAKDLTPNATTDYTEPAWSPDGHTLALRTPTGVATVPADGSKAPVQISDYPGLPAYRG